MQLGIYVVVSDLDASSTFYERLFGKEPYVVTESFVGFDVSGGLYGLFLDTAFDHELARGNNAVPYLRVSDIDAEFERVSDLSTDMIHDEVIDEGVIRLFMFSDPDGNAIEFYSVPPPPTE